MHYAYPARKASVPTAFTPRQNRQSIIHSIRRRVRLRTLGVLTSVIIFLYLLLSWRSSSSSRQSTSPAAAPAFTKAPSGSPNVVVVTVLDSERGEIFNSALKRNREAYAEKHGYSTFTPPIEEYDVGDSPSTWAKVPALRHAMTRFPNTPYFLYLDDHTLIADPKIKLEDHLVSKARIEELAITDIPVVPPDSVIKTLQGVPGDQVDLLLVQDREGLSINSFVLRAGDWSRYFLDTWFDPLYRSYNFQKAERHALEHIVQWHGTLLSKLALIPQDIISTYGTKDTDAAVTGGTYSGSNFIVSFPGCDGPNRSCREEMRPWFEKLHGLEI